MKINAFILLLIGSCIFLCLIYAFYTQGYFTGRVLVLRAYYLSMPYLAPTLINSFALALSGILILHRQTYIASCSLLFSGIGFLADRLLTYFFYKHLYMYPHLPYSDNQVLNTNYLIEVYFPLVLAAYAFTCLFWLFTRNKARPLVIFAFLAVAMNALIIILARTFIDDKFYQVIKW